MKFLIINGPNLNLLGQREPGIYGQENYQSLCERLPAFAAAHGSPAQRLPSHPEGGTESTHYSVAILDALKAVRVPCIEVHISNIHQREEFRHRSVTAPACVGQICGLGLYGYEAAMSYFLSREKVGKESFDPSRPSGTPQGT